MTERKALEELASWLNTTDDSRCLGWEVAPLYRTHGELIIKGDGVNYTKDEAIIELENRERYNIETALGIHKALDKVRKGS